MILSPSPPHPNHARHLPNFFTHPYAHMHTRARARTHTPTRTSYRLRLAASTSLMMTRPLRVLPGLRPRHLCSKDQPSSTQRSTTPPNTYAHKQTAYTHIYIACTNKHSGPAFVDAEVHHIHHQTPTHPNTSHVPTLVYQTSMNTTILPESARMRARTRTHARTPAPGDFICRGSPCWGWRSFPGRGRGGRSRGGGGRCKRWRSG